MNARARLGLNTLWLLAARLGTQGLMVLFTILIARRLGDAGLGEYAFMASAIFLANVLTTFGTDMWLIREIAAGAGLAQVPAALAVQLALSALFVVLTFVSAPSLPGQSPDAVLALQLYSLALFPLAFYTVFTAVLRGQERMEWYTLLNLAASLLQLAAVWWFVQPGGRVVTVAWLLLGSQVAAAALAGLICALKVPGFLRAWRFSVTAVPAVVRVSAPIALLGLLGMSYQKLSIYLLSTLAGAAATGAFSAALRVVEASKTGHLALFGALYPAMAQAQAGSTDETGWWEALNYSWKALLALAGIAALALSFLAAPLVHFLYGPAFAASIPALQILAWMLIPYTVNTYLSLAFLAAGQERYVARALLASLITLSVLNAWWIPSAGLLGACWAAVVAEFVQAGALLLQSPNPSRYLHPLSNKWSALSARAGKQVTNSTNWIESHKIFVQHLPWRAVPGFVLFIRGIRGKKTLVNPRRAKNVHDLSELS
jgi:O-antigen/teichoic acid export membrane protein